MVDSTIEAKRKERKEKHRDFIIKLRSKSVKARKELEYHKLRYLNSNERDVLIKREKGIELSDVSDTSDGENCLAPIEALNKVVVSRAGGVHIPENMGLDMCFDLKNKDVPATTHGPIKILIHYVSPVKNIVKESVIPESAGMPTTERTKKEFNKRVNDSFNNLKNVRTAKPQSVNRMLINLSKIDCWWKNKKDIESWSSIQYSCPFIPSLYQQHHIPLIYDKKKVPLSSEQEQMANLVALEWDTYEIESKQCWLDSVRELTQLSNKIQNVQLIDMTAIKEYLMKKHAINKCQDNYYIVDDKLRYSRVKTLFCTYSRLLGKRKGTIIDRCLPEDACLKGCQDTIIPACSLRGHNWQSFDVHLGYPYIVESKLDKRMRKIPDGLQVVRISKNVEEEFIRCVAACLKRYREFEYGHLEDSNMSLKQKATLLWLQDNFSLMCYSSTSKDKLDSCIRLKVKDIELEKNKFIIKNWRSCSVLQYDMTEYEDGIQVYQNLKEFCQNKSLNDYLFTVSKQALITLLTDFDSILTPQRFVQFQLNYIIYTMLQEDIPINMVYEDKAFILKRVILTAQLATHISKHMIDEELIRLQTDLSICEKQIRELKEMKIDVQNGKTIRLLNEKEKQILEKKVSISKKAFEKKMKKSYKKYKKEEKEMNKDTPMNKEEWETYWKSKQNSIIRRKLQKQAALQHLFKKQPTVDMISQRIHNYKEKKEIIKEKIYSQESEMLDSTERIVSRNVDPRIIVSWCKRVECPIECVYSNHMKDIFVWAMETKADFVY